MLCCKYLLIHSQVMNANLLIFKTVIAGDSWGEVAVPVIQEFPLAIVIFMGFRTAVQTCCLIDCRRWFSGKVRC